MFCIISSELASFNPRPLKSERATPATPEADSRGKVSIRARSKVSGRHRTRRLPSPMPGFNPRPLKSERATLLDRHQGRDREVSIRARSKVSGRPPADSML